MNELKSRTRLNLKNLISCSDDKTSISNPEVSDRTRGRGLWDGFTADGLVNVV